MRVLYCLYCRSALQRATQMRQTLTICRRTWYSTSPDSARELSEPSPTKPKQSCGSQILKGYVDVDALLSKPTWSVRSLQPPQADATAAASDEDGTTPKPTPSMTPAQLQHLLRLSALPQPTSLEEEQGMLRTLDSQLHFVRAIQALDTKGVEPLVTIRDETEQGLREATIGLRDPGIAEALQAESKVGRMGRVRRVPVRLPRNGRYSQYAERSTQDKRQGLWRPLEWAPGRTEGSYFVVKSGKGEQG